MARLAPSDSEKEEIRQIDSRDNVFTERKTKSVIKTKENIIHH